MEVGIGMGCAAAGLTLFLLLRTIQNLENLQVKLEDSFQDVDRFMKKRVDVHARWAETVAAYDLDAQGILAEMTAMRDRFDEMSVEEKVRLCEKLDNLSAKMTASAKRCPRLRTSATYISLHEEADRLIAEMPDACGVYNTQAEQLNEALRRFPANMTAVLSGCEKKELFSRPEKNSAAV